ncbi:MAG: lipoprotein [Arenicellales bacterium]|nr:lipoprotein [Arenicellales bacterium]
MVKYYCQTLLMVAAIGTATTILTGCGQKGPLYLHSDTLSEQEQLEAEQERLQAIQQQAEEEVLGPQRQEGDTGSLIPSRSP